ncbi:phosphatase PAP2 family protein [[Clostridium] dakarense]|nr:phosphatase PAP2 family protein [[Clostridium] dakarense]
MVRFNTFNILISWIIGQIWYTPRPFINNSNTHLLYQHKADSSFPSDHTLASMSIALGLNKYSRIIGIISMAISILIGISRVYVGHHYPQHVVGSYIMAIVLHTKILYHIFSKAIMILEILI